MRPQRLELRFFGPYRHEVIDFTAFADVPLFLISGKTGSGKTTIFDAMCYALFNQTSGGDRKAEDMRSDFAGPSDETAVVFTFTHQGRTYEVRRQPAQTLAKKRGSGVKHVAAQVMLTVWDDQQRELEQLQKPNTVGPYLERLLQMNRQQFAQIVLLPQGEFRQFLTAPSDAKAQLLQKLFSTQLYARWTEIVKDRAKASQKTLEAHKATVSRLVQGLVWHDDWQRTVAEKGDTLSPNELLSLMDQELASDQHQLTQLDKRVAAAETTYSQLNRRDVVEAQLVKDQQALSDRLVTQRSLNDQQDAMQQRRDQVHQLEWAQSIQPIVTERQRLTRTLAETQASLATTQHEQKAQQTAVEDVHQQSQALASVSDTIRQRDRQLTALQAIKPVYQEVTDLKARSATLGTTEKQTLDQLAQQQATHQRHLEQQQQLAGLVADEAAAISEQSHWQHRLDQLQAQQKVGDEAVKQTAALATLKESLAAAEQQVTAATASLSTAETTYDQVFQGHLRTQIAELSAQLTDGSPCPVCGATTHPAPMTTTVVAVTAQQVEAARAHLTAAQAAVSQAQATADQLARQIVRDQQRLTETVTGLQTATALTDASVTTIVQTLTQRAQQATDQLLSLDNQLQKITQSKPKLAAVVSKLDEDETRLADLGQQWDTLTNDRVALEAQIKEKERRLPAEFADLSALVAALDRLTAQNTADTARVEQATQTERQAEKRLAATSAKVTQLQTEVRQLQASLETATTQWQAALTAHFSSVTVATIDQVQTWLTQLAQLPALRRTIQDYDQQVATNQQQVTDLQARVKDQPKPDRDATQRALASAKEDLTQAQTDQHALADQLKQNRAGLEDLTTALASQRQALEDAQEIYELASVMAGDGPVSRIGLERHVLQIFLNQIIQVANPKLNELSNGRYQFVLDDESGSAKKYAGLEIDVYDDHVGETRSVHTLSGGESFIAALALALALGEVIQENSGGITVEALFIDEGFGSLDDEALMTALEALETIEGRYRMIGIISHVSELKTQVPNQLQVIAEGNGESHTHNQIED